jgi:hypothetical protein
MNVVARRSYGTGSLFVRANRRGEETWFGQWRIDGTLVKRRIGPKRRSSGDDGLTKAQAERELRRVIESMTVVPTVMDVGEAGRRWLAHLEAIGRRRSTLMDYESAVRIHLVPFCGARQIVAADVERWSSARRAGRRRACATGSGCCTRWRIGRSSPSTIARHSPCRTRSPPGPARGGRGSSAGRAA